MTNIVDGRCGCNWLRFMIFCDVCWNLAQSSQLKSALQAQLGTRMFSNRFLSSSIVRSNLEISSWPSMQNHIMNSWRPSSSSSPTIHWGIDHLKKNIILGQESIIFHPWIHENVHPFCQSLACFQPAVSGLPASNARFLSDLLSSCWGSQGFCRPFYLSNKAGHWRKSL